MDTAPVNASAAYSVGKRPDPLIFFDKCTANAIGLLFGLLVILRFLSPELVCDLSARRGGLLLCLSMSAPNAIDSSF
jgi:hypothetical protein